MNAQRLFREFAADGEYEARPAARLSKHAPLHCRQGPSLVGNGVRRRVGKREPRTMHFGNCVDLGWIECRSWEGVSLKRIVNVHFPFVYRFVEVPHPPIAWVF